MTGLEFRNIAPDVFRQRLLLEGFWTIDLTAETVKAYLLGLTAHLDLRTYGDPIVFSPTSGMGKDENAGFDAFVPLIDSGISCYFWSKRRFFSIVLYTCKGFDADRAEAFTRSFLKAEGESARLSF